MPLTCDFHLSVTITTWDISLGSFSSQLWVDDVTTMRQNLKILRERFHLKQSFTLDFHLSIRDSGFKNENFTINFFLQLTIIFLLPFVHEIKVWTLFDPILGQWRHHRSQICNILRKRSQKQTLHFKVPSSIDFYLMRSYAGNLPQFWKFVKDGITNRIQKQVKRWI